MLNTKCGFNSIPGRPGSDFLVAYGPTLLVDIGFDPSFNPQKLGTVPVPGIKQVDALVDSGASESCIDNLLASQLGLPIIDRRPISGSGGSHMTNIYLAQVHVPALNFTIYGAFAGVDLLAGGQVHKALIGRTFLRHFTMVYEGQTGTVTLSSP